ncbi:MAG: LuxR C-terminal-related transcriptional regulator [Pseudomonadota bacterium]
MILSEALSPSDVIRLRHAMAQAGTRRFFTCFKRLLQARLKFDTFLLFRFDPGTVPQVLDSWIKPKSLPLDVLDEYVEGFYRLDPFFQLKDIPAKGLTTRLSDIAPDRFFSSEYYLQYYRRTRICEEVGLLAPLPSGSVAHLSLSRLETTGPYRRRELQCLMHYSPVLMELLTTHCSRFETGKRLKTPDSAPPLLDQIILTQVYETLGLKLTRREAQIAGLVLQGHSNGSAALLLGISKETSKVHRRNLYRKLDISSQRELFTLLRHLL